MKIERNALNLVNCRECNQEIKKGGMVIEELCFDCYYEYLRNSQQVKETLESLFNQLHTHQKEASLLKSSMDAHEEAIQAILNKLDKIVKDYR